ncbi:acid protease [Laetiporus sulphureus 93-53]|uniref:Acid protease n=1 Tax=Laetiporus sulphureus 93-53 TaxID=1314785 RepID=A0A165IM11_9APHY|nr:acid protease [Laetiporus sulphureus 93-53]KZT13266.1 acid protease [Laetiporus sulphureus 93-53]
MQLPVAFIISAFWLLFVHAVPAEIPRGTKIALSKRSNLAGPDGIIYAAEVQTHVARSLGKIQDGFASYQKNTGEAHPLAEHYQPTKSKRGAIPLTDDMNGQMWQGAISVGTPPQDVTVDFDTGSADLVLPGPTCEQNCAGHHYYHPEASKSSSTRSSQFTLRYGDGSYVTGEQYADTVNVGGLTATNATVGAAQQYSEGLAPSNFPPDGILGLAYPSVTSFHQPTVFQALMQENQIKNPVFAFKLGSDGPELMLGGINDDLHQGDITYTPVTQQGYWQVNIDGVSANGNKTLENVSAIIDTGTTLIIGNPDQVAQLYATIPGAKQAPESYGSGFYTVPCNAIPTISLSFGGKGFDISTDLINLGPVDSGSSDCLAGLAGQGGMNFWIVGDVFLQNVYTVFDFQNNQVGFANLA